MLNGLGVSPGKGIGKVVQIAPKGQTVKTMRAAADPDSELVRLAAAIDRAVDELEALAVKLEQELGEDEALILRTQQDILNDPLLAEQMENAIEAGKSAEAASAESLNAFAMMFAEVPDPRVKERASDIADARERLLAALAAETEGVAGSADSGAAGTEGTNGTGRTTGGTGYGMLAELPEGTVIVAEELTPSMTANLDKNSIAAIVTERGGQTSHAAILARAMGIPAVLGVEKALEKLADGAMVAVDGDEGTVEEVSADAMADAMAAVAADVAAAAMTDAAADAMVGAAAESAGSVEAGGGQAGAAFGAQDLFDMDGNLIMDGMAPVYCNIGSAEEAAQAARAGAAGIGLLRTEFLFLGREEAPSEEEQYEAYKAVCEAMNADGIRAMAGGDAEAMVDAADGAGAVKPVIARMLDIGGDKEIPFLAGGSMGAEDNPFLGVRGIRVLLQEDELFETQARAMIRANADTMQWSNSEAGALRILLPMVSTVTEVKAAREWISALAEDLELPMPKVGAMIETPAAAMMADVLAEYCDFFSIGTNDLTQYMMAADRGNSHVAHLYNICDPAVLRVIRHVIEAGNEAGIPVEMCGEAAAETKITAVLLGFGLDVFSVTPVFVPRVTKEIARWSRVDEKAAKIAEKVAVLETAAEVEEFLS